MAEQQPIPNDQLVRLLQVTDGNIPADDGMEENLIDIPMEDIDDKSMERAKALIDNLGEIYADKEFIENNPKFVQRLEAEIENLRILIKMRQTDEVTHDCIVKAICKNSTNASLYRSLTDIQRTILNISKQMDDKVSAINNLLKNIQLEFNFDKKEDSSDDIQPHQPEGTFYRGSKDFISEMREKLNK